MSVFFFLFLFATLQAAFAFKNVTVSHGSSNIAYKPDSNAWNSSESQLDYSKSHVVTSTKGATASFTFTGVAIYYVTAQWPYAVSSTITLDGGAGTFVDLRDYVSTQNPSGGSASVQASAHWKKTGLSNSSHTIVISIPSNATYAVLDTLIYTVDDGKDDDPSSQTSKSSPKWPIILGSALGGVALVGALLAIYLLYWRRRKSTPKPIWDGPENTITPLVTYEETYPLVTSAGTDVSRTQSALSSASMPTLSHFEGEEDPSSLPTTQFVEGSSGSRFHESPSIVGYSRDVKKPIATLGVANSEVDELPPPAYSEAEH